MAGDFASRSSTTRRATASTRSGVPRGESLFEAVKRSVAELLIVSIRSTSECPNSLEPLVLPPPRPERTWSHNERRAAVAVKRPSHVPRRG